MAGVLDMGLIPLEVCTNTSWYCRLKAEADARDVDDYSKDLYGKEATCNSKEKTGRRWIEVQMLMFFA